MLLIAGIRKRYLKLPYNGYLFPHEQKLEAVLNMVWSSGSFISLKTQFLSVWIFLVLSICFIPRLFPFRAKCGCQAVSVIIHLVQSSETQRHRDIKMK